MKLDPQAVREARERLGYSIDKTGEEGDLSPNSVLRAEHGEEIRPSTARRLARALNVEVKDLYPKVGSRSSPEPSLFNGVEDERHDEEFLAARRYLIPLMDGYTTAWLGQIADYGPAIANLPEDLTPNDSFAALQWVARFIRDCERDESAVEKAGVMEAVVDGVLGRASEGRHVPAEILEKARAFREAWQQLFVAVELTALRWVQSQSKRPDVVAFSEERRKAANADAEFWKIVGASDFGAIMSKVESR